LTTRALFISPMVIAALFTPTYDREASVNRFVGPKRIVGIAGVYEAGVTTGA
jgi:hypothetical protein